MKQPTQTEIRVDAKVWQSFVSYLVSSVNKYIQKVNTK